MIGVLARDEDMPWVAEFFELFKTPWERAQGGRRYRVLLNTDGSDESVSAHLTIVYRSVEVGLDRQSKTSVAISTNGVALTWERETVPIYGAVATFGGEAGGSLSVSGRSADYRIDCGDKVTHRVGYDLFREVAHLLTHGQPTEWAGQATLELHIAFLKRCLESARISYLEIPPRPHGSDFVCCLTHDVDFYGIRRHGFDRTMAGFVLRGTVGSVVDVVRRRRTAAEAFRNLKAVASIPFVHLGVSRDLWEPLDDYRRADRGLPSTFFVVPFKGRPGVSPEGHVEPRRAVKYGVGDVSERVRAASESSSNEFAVHGLDAWRDASLGREERAALAAATPDASDGVRMHWLYFSNESAEAIEAAGFRYDSTCGYNETIGYKAGTMQAFRLPGSQDVLELPMAVMDTAMFYPDYLNLSQEQALERCRAMMSDARRFGGALVINWHDRSLAPERQWQRAYGDLLDELQAQSVWFATARDSVAWFRWRRSVQFRASASDETVVSGLPAPSGLPGLRLLVNKPSVVHGPIVEERAFEGDMSVVM